MRVGYWLLGVNFIKLEERLVINLGHKEEGSYKYYFELGDFLCFCKPTRAKIKAALALIL